MKQFFNSFFKKKQNPIFIDSKKVFLNENEQIDIILSPKYYWSKKERLPSKYEFQAISYAKSVFEDIIPQGHYSYLCKKEDDGFRFYAYDDTMILQNLNELGIKDHQIRSIHFAQHEFSDILKPIKINSSKALANIDSQIVLIPFSLVDEYQNLDEYFNFKNISNFNVKLNALNQMVDFKAVYMLIFATILFMLPYMAELMLISKTRQELKQKQNDILKSYKLPSTQLQTKALIKNLNSKLKTQSLLREKFDFILKTPLEDGEFFTKITYEKKEFKLKLTLHDKNVKKIEEYLQKELKIKTKKDKNSISVEARYD